MAKREAPDFLKQLGINQVEVYSYNWKESKDNSEHRLSIPYWKMSQHPKYKDSEDYAHFQNLEHYQKNSEGKWEFKNYIPFELTSKIYQKIDEKFNPSNYESELKSLKWWVKTWQERMFDLYSKGYQISKDVGWNYLGDSFVKVSFKNNSNEIKELEIKYKFNSNDSNFPHFEKAVISAQLSNRELLTLGEMKIENPISFSLDLKDEDKDNFVKKYTEEKISELVDYWNLNSKKIQTFEDEINHYNQMEKNQKPVFGEIKASSEIEVNVGMINWDDKFLYKSTVESQHNNFKLGEETFIYRSFPRKNTWEEKPFAIIKNNDFDINEIQNWTNNFSSISSMFKKVVERDLEKRILFDKQGIPYEVKFDSNSLNSKSKINNDELNFRNWSKAADKIINDYHNVNEQNNWIANLARKTIEESDDKFYKDIIKNEHSFNFMERQWSGTEKFKESFLYKLRLLDTKDYKEESYDFYDFNRRPFDFGFSKKGMPFKTEEEWYKTLADEAALSVSKGLAIDFSEDQKQKWGFKPILKTNKADEKQNEKNKLETYSSGGMGM